MPTITFSEGKNAKALIAEGGEGRIYAYQSDYLVKIFKDVVDKDEKLDKIQKTMNLPLPSSVVKPLDLVYNTARRFTGYLMKRIRGEELRALSSRNFVKANNITKKDILQMLAEIASTMNEIHLKRIYIGDLNDANILFDDSCHVHFIDVDSWSIGNNRCNVANEAFKDPKLVANHFNEDTDWYAFAIITYKLLTRLHPFGGVYNPDARMNLEERIKRGITAVNNKDVTVPKIVDKDCFMPKKLLSALHAIFTTGDRSNITPEIGDFLGHLMLCPAHGDYYYSLFNKCPVCVTGAKEMQPISVVATATGVPVRLLFSGPDVKLIFTENVYLTSGNVVKFRNSAHSMPNRKGVYYYANSSGKIIYKVSKDAIEIVTPKRTFNIEKKYNSFVVADGNSAYFISDNLHLTQFILINDETCSTSVLEEVGINNVFHVRSPQSYFICNSYDTKKIVSISGYHHELGNREKIVDSAIHYDEVSGTWLFVFETAKGKFVTTIFEKKAGVLSTRDDIRYACNPKNACYHNELIYIPGDTTITRVNYKTSESKEFKIPVVTTETKITKKQNKFTAVNETEIYEIG